MSRRLKISLMFVAVIVAIAIYSTPARLTGEPAVPTGISVAALGVSETGVIPGAEQRVLWFDGEQKTQWSVVALHGFSATRQETAPLASDVATALQANLFEARLTGHGLNSGALVDVSAEEWLDDTAAALEIGRQLGERVVVIGTSTGATLAAAMLNSPHMKGVDTLVFISPNFSPYDPAADWMTRPAGSLLARLMIGEMRSWEPHNELQGKYWSTRYPTATLIEVMRLVDRANAALPAKIPQRLLVFYSPDDQVISVSRALSAIARIDAADKLLIEILNPGDPSHHVLAGDILSPDSTTEVSSRISEFVAPAVLSEQTP